MAVVASSNHPDSPERRLSISRKFTPQESREEGDKLFKEANKKRLSFQGCRIFRLCSRDKFDGDRGDSMRNYLKAAHHYMNAGEWERAGESYENCARLQELGSDLESMDAASNYYNAAICYTQDKRIKENKGQHSSTRSNRTVSMEMERIRLPSIDETKLQTIDTSVSRLAHMQMDYKNYSKARENFEKLAESLYKKEENETNAEDFFFKAAMCAIADDLETSLEIVEKYYILQPSLETSEKFIFWNKLYQAVNTEDRESFQQLIKENVYMKIWVQKIIADILSNLGFPDLEQNTRRMSRKQSEQGLKNDPFYTLYN